MTEVSTCAQSYSGKLLIAHPEMTTGFFAGTVVYVYQHASDGAVGLALNRATTWPVRELMQDRGFDFLGNDCFYKGGPVNTAAIVLLHSDEWYSSNTLPVGNGLAITSDNFMFEKISMGNEPLQWRMFAGICAWAPGQLEAEVGSRNGWQVAQPDTAVVFDGDCDDQWYKAVQLCGRQTIDSYI